MEFGENDRQTLLRIAHESIAAAVQGLAYQPEAQDRLAEPRGVFTTLYQDAHLRGCVGYVNAVRPLAQAVAETARAAALDDIRFQPVTAPEVPDLRISLSVLSPTFRIDPSQVEIGRHGLVVSQHGWRGLLLPQVALEHGWDAETFLEQTCRKAGLPENAWQRGATLEAFTAEVFGDSGVPA